MIVKRKQPHEMSETVQTDDERRPGESEVEVDRGTTVPVGYRCVRIDAVPFTGFESWSKRRDVDEFRANFPPWSLCATQKRNAGSTG